jgi:RHH-type proline utilization regulon transcriptional repressor/proline dehydrogenase/delta 1-pyrroline-5-carboxylate dehydrogenase
LWTAGVPRDAGHVNDSMHGEAQGFEREVNELGLRLFAAAAEETPGIFDAQWWSGKMIDASVRNAAFKTAMFRFVDVFPVLRDSDDVARHVQEYFEAIDEELPAAFRLGVRVAGAGSLAARAAAAAARKNIGALAKRFIAGASPEEALPVMAKLWEAGTAFSVDLLGEATLSPSEAEAYSRRYLVLLDALAAAAAGWPSRPELEQGPWGALPRVNVSVKPSALHWHLDPVDFDGSVERLSNALHPIFRRAHELGAFINVDVEQHALKAITYAAFERTLEQEDLGGFEHAGIVCQAYLRESLADLEQLAAWARARGRPLTVRLVKGAYWDFEVLRARQEGHRLPVFDDKDATDANFERCARHLAEHAGVLHPAFGTHNVRSLAAALVHARRAGLADEAVEVQMLYGMAESLKHAVSKLGYRVREYVPVG